MKEALEPLLGKQLKGFSASTVTQLKKVWTDEYNAWNLEPIAERIVYLWADGVYFNIRLGEDQKMCILVIIGATARGEKKASRHRSRLPRIEDELDLFTNKIERSRAG